MAVKTYMHFNSIIYLQFYSILKFDLIELHVRQLKVVNLSKPYFIFELMMAVNPNPVSYAINKRKISVKSKDIIQHCLTLHYQPYFILPFL